jgi:hypothetical protein
LSLPAQFNVTGSPVTGSGTLTAAWAHQTATYFLAGPTSGPADTPAFRAVAATDVPTLNQSTSGNAATATASDHSPTQCSTGNYSTGDTTAWAANCAQVQYSQLGGTVPTWNQDTSGNAATATTAATASAAPWSGLTGIPGNFPGGATGNAATATALAATPGQCSAGQFSTGITTAGSANCSVPTQTITFSSAGSSLGTSGTIYMGIGYAGGSQYKGGFIAQRAGTVQNCSAAVAAAVTGTNYWTATLLKNGTACTSGPIIVINGGAHTVATDSTHTCTVAQYDQLTWQFTATGTIPSSDVGWASCLY